MKNKLEITRKEAAVDKFMVLSQDVPGRTEENHKKT
jgi:hypothetical protein